MHGPLLWIVTLSIALLAAGPAAAGDPPERDTLATADGELTIHPVNHATFVMTGAGHVIYVDPVGGAEAFEGFDPPDLILVTHIHGDHTSPETLAAVSTGSTVILAPPSVSEKIGGVPGSVTVIANGEVFERAGVRVEAVPAYNLTEERMSFHPKGRDNGYVVTIGGRRIYISGDTEDIPEMRALKDIDAAFVCMNLPYTMTVEQAADAVLDFAPTVVYPYHFRGKDGMSDLDTFTRLVAADPAIEVRILDWY